jgi:CubicO group peptidase (beta-lactamase class C family)
MSTLQALSRITAGAFLLSSLANGVLARDPVDAYVQAQMRARNIPGLSLAVVRRGKVVKAAGYGMANVELSVAATQHTVYELASMTKPFTALAIMLLLHDGKLSLDDPVVRYVVELPHAWRSVTIRHLLTHTSGIPNHTDLPVIVNDESRDYTRAEMLAFLAAVPVEFPPGKRWAYNNSGYFLLGLVIEKAAGQSYEQFLSERIFQPLQMTATRGNNVDELIPNRAAGYVIRGGRLLRARG